LTGWRRRPRAGTLIPRLSSGAANAKGGETEHEIDDMHSAAVAPTVADHFAVIGAVLSKGRRRDKRPTRKFFAVLPYFPAPGWRDYSHPLRTASDRNS